MCESVNVMSVFDTQYVNVVQCSAAQCSEVVMDEDRR
jgi:hypothetical protein